MSNYQEIDKTLMVLSALVNKKDAESAEKLAAGLELLNKQMVDFFKTKPQLEKDQFISLLARVDSLALMAGKQSAQIKTDVSNINQRLKAQKGYKAK